jgi:hypothetical protein
MKKLIKAVVTGAAALLSYPTVAFAQIQNIVIEEPEGGVKNFGDLLSAGIQIALIIAAILTFAFLVWGGIEWIASGGDKTKYEFGYFFGIDVFDFQIPTAAK